MSDLVSIRDVGIPIPDVEMVVVERVAPAPELPAAAQAAVVTPINTTAKSEYRIHIQPSSETVSPE
jgi:hypothetical protein